MEEASRQARMYVDLVNSETDARSAQHRVTSRAELYLAAGLPLDEVLKALKISRATWYRRVEQLRASEIANTNAWNTRKGTHETYSAAAFDEHDGDGNHSIYIFKGEPDSTDPDGWSLYSVDDSGRDAADEALGVMGWKRTNDWTKHSDLGGIPGWFATVERTEPDEDEE